VRGRPQRRYWRLALAWSQPRRVLHPTAHGAALDAAPDEPHPSSRTSLVPPRPSPLAPQGAQLPGGCPEEVCVDVQWDFLEPLAERVGLAGTTARVPGGRELLVTHPPESGPPVRFRARLNAVVAAGACRVRMPLPPERPGGGGAGAAARAVWVQTLPAVRDEAGPELAEAASARLLELQRELSARNNEVCEAG
jgi:hypothetical protein